MRHLMVILLLSSLLFSCKNYVRIDYDKNFDVEKKNIEKLVVLPILFFEYDKNSNLINTSKKEIDLRNTIEMSLEKLDKEIVMTDSFKTQNTPEYLNYLLPLQNDIIRSSDLHQDPYMFQYGDKKMTRKFFVQTPKIQPEYITYSDTYDTPYVLFTGVVSKNNKSYHYIIIANIDKSEILYRRLNLINKKINNGNLYPVIYNSIISVFK